MSIEDFVKNIDSIIERGEFTVAIFNTRRYNNE